MAGDLRLVYSTEAEDNTQCLRFAYRLSNADTKDNHRKNVDRYWWLAHGDASEIPPQFP